ncbi:MAG TPA: AAA family ATPase, partial [Solirubrobacteraceae bacterium]|nr:AAA family ATPase [Solirubrobacteraceae bacterium]
GRDAERSRLAYAWRIATDGQTQIVLLSGEPGIGKTRLAGRAALDAYRDGATVLYGRCDEDLGVAYQPWREALGHLVANGPIAVMRDHVVAYGGEIARLVPEFHSRLDEVPAPQDSDPETERYLLYSAVRGLLEATSKRSPIVLVLDDLHWADGPTLSLLRHTVDASPRAALLVIATFRSSELSSSDPLNALLADLAREQGAATRLALEGLREQEILALLEGIAGHDLGSPGARLAQELHRETDGNPFFVVELLRHLGDSGALVQDSDGRWTVREEVSRLELSESVREMIAGRVGRLGEGTRRALTTAAVIGRDVELALLAQVSGEGEDVSLDHLERAQAASLVVELPERPGWFSFTHALVQHALYEDLGPTRRARLHRRIAEALERACGDQPGERVGELARHWSRAAAPDKRSTAAEYAMRAGQHALEQLAPDEAQRWFEQALELLGDSADGGRRREVLVLLGEAQRQTGDPHYRDTLVEAAGLAQRAGDVDRQARAVIAAWRGFSTLGRRDDELLAALEAAAQALPRDDPRRAAVLAELAAELSFSASLERRRTLADEALGLARRVGDVRLLCRVLVWHSYATEVAHTIDTRLAHLAEARALADTTADPWLQFQAETKSCSLLEAGDIDGFDECLARMRDLQEAVQQPTMGWVVQFTESARALIAGRLDEAEKAAIAALERSGNAPDGLTVFGAQIAAVRRDQGRYHELVDLAAQAVLDNPAAPAFRVVHAMALCSAGRHDEARPLLAASAANGFGSIPLDHLWSSTLVAWTEVASALGDHDAAASLYEQLLPHASTVAWTGATTSGPVARALGRLALLLQRLDEAEAHLTSAFAAHERMGSPIWQADTERLLGLTLVGQPGGDAARGRELLGRAADTARRYGAAHIEREAEVALTQYAVR